MFARLIGALCSAAIVYANYFHAIDIFEGGWGIRSVPGTVGLSSRHLPCVLHNLQSLPAVNLVLIVTTARIGRLHDHSHVPHTLTHTQHLA